MNTHSRQTAPQEIELKLSLPGIDCADLAKRLARIPLLARRKAASQSLHNTYYDTPDQALRQRLAVLRLRRVGSEAHPQWLQTLKTGTSDASALSRRGEWETAVPGPALNFDALKDTAWSDFDPSGSLFERLTPCFVTIFERISWLIRKRDGSVVEVALDIGHIEAGGKRAPICELELELKAGQPSALFAIAKEVASAVAVLPANMSKAQRGFLLAQNGLVEPYRAQPTRLTTHLTRSGLAQQLLRKMFAQFTMNLNSLCTSDDTEVLHQARIGWRRFKSGLHLLKKIPGVAAAPVWHDLQPLLTCLSAQRNLDVALTETLPRLSPHYCLGDVKRTQSWQAMVRELNQAAAAGRQAVRCALQEPSVGTSLLLLAEWLETLASENTGPEQKKALRHWAKRRILRLHHRMQRAQQEVNTPEGQHRVRILAKRLRYGVEALHDLLPNRLAALCFDEAASLQASLGNSRDIAQASALVAKLHVNPTIAAYLHGVVVGSDLLKRPFTDQ